MVCSQTNSGQPEASATVPASIQPFSWLVYLVPDPVGTWIWLTNVVEGHWLSSLTDHKNGDVTVNAPSGIATNLSHDHDAEGDPQAVFGLQHLLTVTLQSLRLLLASPGFSCSNECAIREQTVKQTCFIHVEDGFKFEVLQKLVEICNLKGPGSLNDNIICCQHNIIALSVQGDTSESISTGQL
jgi:hypothetical protein